MTMNAKRDYIKNKVEDCGGDQKRLFQLVNNLLGRSKISSLPSDKTDIANRFSLFFHEKICRIRQSMSGSEDTVPETHHDCGWTDFQLASHDEIVRFIKSSPCKSCRLDPVPTWIIKQAPAAFAEMMLPVINSSLLSARVPVSFKTALVTPLLKKKTLDPESLSSYRPVSQLSFISKVLEKVVANRLCSYLEENDLYESMQSAYRPGHSVETALVKVTNDILTAVDQKQMVLLVLLDLSAAFDTVDHGILLRRMHDRFGVSGDVLQWFHSYLDMRSQAIAIGETTSEQRILESGVPQGSVLGPILFTMYTTPLGDIARRHGMNFHLYADDTQLYVTFKQGVDDACLQIEDCVNDMQQWMDRNFLKLNNEKTDILLVGSRHQHSTIDLSELTINNVALPVSDVVRDLGVQLDKILSMDSHVSSICKSSYYHLWNIARIRRYLSNSDAAKVIHALVTSRVDCCNAVLAGLPMSLLSRLQRVLNSAARVLVRARKFDHITPVLKDLHWLPVPKRIDYKILTLVFKALNNTAPKYITDLISIKQCRYPLRSATSPLLIVPRCRTTHYGDRAFQRFAPMLWNKLPNEIRGITCLKAFQMKIKEHLFVQSYQ